MSYFRSRLKSTWERNEDVSVKLTEFPIPYSSSHWVIPGTPVPGTHWMGIPEKPLCVVLVLLRVPSLARQQKHLFAQIAALLVVNLIYSATHSSCSLCVEQCVFRDGSYSSASSWKGRKLRRPRGGRDWMEQVESSNAEINTKILFHGVIRSGSSCVCGSRENAQWQCRRPEGVRGECNWLGNRMRGKYI